jgi:hypothetical protein
LSFENIGCRAHYRDRHWPIGKALLQRSDLRGLSGDFDTRERARSARLG